ncbi:MAG TPA: peptide deformylase [Petrimonas sp.]|nr:peptide deformylase [Petrimonas sp.]
MNRLNGILLVHAVLLSVCLQAQQHSDPERALVLSGDTTAMMRVLTTSHAGDAAILNAECRDLDPFDPMVRLLSQRMFLSMRDSANPGVGIAAPQVGIKRNAFWIQRFDKQGFPFEFMINPVILSYSALKRRGGEGCLSIPGVRGEVLRSYAIMVEYRDFSGGWHTELLEDFTAVIFQHEYDHLKGILFTDRMDQQLSFPVYPLPEGTELFLGPPGM